MKLKIQSLALLLMITGTTTTISCKKDKDVATVKTKAELLTTGNWKYTACIISPSYDYYGDGNSVTNIFDILKPCEKDDFETFKTNGIWEYNEGPTKCDQSSPQVFTEPWSFSADETKLFEGAVEHTILELNASMLKLRYSFEDAGVTYTEVDTYSH
jgi:hypothetical protein